VGEAKQKAEFLVI